MKACHLIAFITACCLSLPASARQAEIDRERMQQDLDIMETILQNLHTQNTPAITGIHKKPQIRGLYFENYGVIFLIEERRPAGIKLTLKSFGSTTEASGKYEESDVVKGIRAQRHKRRVALQDRLGEFLGTYADAIRQLKDEDRITVLVHYQPVSPVSFADVKKAGADLVLGLQTVAKQLYQDSLKPLSPISKEALDHTSKIQAVAKQEALDHRSKLQAVTKQLDSLISKEALDHRSKLQAVAKQLDSLKSSQKGRKVQKQHVYRVLSEPIYSEVTAKKRDIVAYRRERISEAEFRKRIVSREHKPDASTVKKIGVLATILDKALKRPDHLAPSFDKTLGIYQEGLGALFFVNAGSGYRADHPVFKNKLKAFTSPPHRRTQGKAGTEERQILDRFKEDLVNVVGDYGYSLRTLKPQEYIVVEIRFPEAVWKRRWSNPQGLAWSDDWSNPRGLVLKVQKKDVDAYIREDLDLAAFRQKVDIQEY